MHKVADELGSRIQNDSVFGTRDRFQRLTLTRYRNRTEIIRNNLRVIMKNTMINRNGCIE